MTRVLLIALAICLWCGASIAEAAIMARLKAGEKLTLCAIGTSVTGDYYDPEKKAGVPSAWFPQLGKWLDELYPGQVTLFNEGIGGAASKYTPTYTQANGASGLDFQLDRALTHDPEVLFIEFACNDAYLGYGISRQMSKDNLQAMVDRACDLGRVARQKAGNHRPNDEQQYPRGPTTRPGGLLSGLPRSGAGQRAALDRPLSELAQAL